jgi:hypothetical protein
MLARRAAVMVGFLVFALASFGASPQPVGMLNSAGSDNVAVGGVTVPSGTTLYMGDTIETASGYARFTLSSGAGFVVNPNSKVRLTDAQSVEFLKGMSRIESRGVKLTLIAAAWALTPSLDSKTGRVSADVVVEDSGRVSVNVSEGRLTATNKATKEVAVAQLGRPVLLPAAAAPSAAPQPPAGTPKTGASSNAKTIGAYVVGVTAAAIGIAAIATRPEAGVDPALQPTDSVVQRQRGASDTDNLLKHAGHVAPKLADLNGGLQSAGADLAGAVDIDPHPVADGAVYVGCQPEHDQRPGGKGCPGDSADGRGSGATSNAAGLAGHVEQSDFFAGQPGGGCGGPDRDSDTSRFAHVIYRP